MLSHQKRSIKSSMFIVYRLLKEFNNNYTRKFSSSMIERQFECNFDYLNRIFKKQTGYSPTQYRKMVLESYSDGGRLLLLCIILSNFCTKPPSLFLAGTRISAPHKSLNHWLFLPSCIRRCHRKQLSVSFAHTSTFPF